MAAGELGRCVEDADAYLGYDHGLAAKNILHILQPGFYDFFHFFTMTCVRSWEHGARFHPLAKGANGFGTAGSRPDWKGSVPMQATATCELRRTFSHMCKNPQQTMCQSFLCKIGKQQANVSKRDAPKRYSVSFGNTKNAFSPGHTGYNSGFFPFSLPARVSGTSLAPAM